MSVIYIKHIGRYECRVQAADTFVFSIVYCWDDKVYPPQRHVAMNRVYGDHSKKFKEMNSEQDVWEYLDANDF